MPVRKFFKDILLHIKSKNEETKGVTEKTSFPITRWENILGAPRLLTEDTLDGNFPSEYAVFLEGEIAISDEEYDRVFSQISMSE